MIICYNVIYEGCNDGDDAPSFFDTSHIQNPKLKAKVEATKDYDWFYMDKLSEADQEDLQDALDQPQVKLPCMVDKTIVIYHE